MSQKSNNKAVKAYTTGNIGTKYELPRQNDRNIFPLTNKNLNVFNIRNETTSESYNSSNSSLDNDPDDDPDDDADDDAETVITNYDSKPYGLTTSQRPNYRDDEMNVDNYEPPPTELLTRDGKKMFYIINNKLEPVTNSNYNRDTIVYDQNRDIILTQDHLPENRLFINNDIIMDESSGGKKKRKTRRKTLRKTKRKTRKTRRYFRKKNRRK